MSEKEISDEGEIPASPASPDPKQLWMKHFLAPGAFFFDPEIDAVLKTGTTIDAERAKEIARRVIRCLKHYIPKAKAMQDAVRAVDDLAAAIKASTDTIIAADTALATDPDDEEFLTPGHEFAARGARIGRQIVMERNVISEEELEAIDDEVWERAREEMKARGRPPPELIRQDPAPLVLLRLRQSMEGLGHMVQMLGDRHAGIVRSLLEAGLTPYQTGGRPAMDLAMFIAWLLQDTGPREMPDHHVVRFLEDECKDAPLGAPQLIPSVKSVAEWRKQRAKIPGICPRRDGSQNPK